MEWLEQGGRWGLFVRRIPLAVIEIERPPRVARVTPLGPSRHPSRRTPARRAVLSFSDHAAARGVAWATVAGGWTPRPKTVLIVGDHPPSRETYATIVRHAGYLVLEARNSAEGVRMARERLPSLILMDLTMPGMGGWEAAGLLKERGATSHIPICALSGHGRGAEDRARAERAGFVSYLAQPIEPRDVVLQVEALIGPAVHE